MTSAILVRIPEKHKYTDIFIERYFNTGRIQILVLTNCQAISSEQKFCYISYESVPISVLIAWQLVSTRI